mgnify:CR=1 FL=1
MIGMIWLVGREALPAFDVLGAPWTRRVAVATIVSTTLVAGLFIGWPWMIAAALAGEDLRVLEDRCVDRPVAVRLEHVLDRHAAGEDLVTIDVDEDLRDVRGERREGPADPGLCVGGEHVLVDRALKHVETETGSVLDFQGQAGARTDAGELAVAAEAGTVAEVTGASITMAYDSGKKETFHLSKFRRSNQGTCINQRILVKEGDVVPAGAVASRPPTKA